MTRQIYLEAGLAVVYLLRTLGPDESAKREIIIPLLVQLIGMAHGKLVASLVHF